MKAVAAALASALMLTACVNGSAPQTAAVPTVPVPPRIAGDVLFPDLQEFVPRITAAGGCVTDAEITAEQFIAIRTSMMVTGLTCRGVYDDVDNLFGTYQQFTVDNAQRLRETQTLIGRYLSRHQRGHFARLFDTYQTSLANEEALLVTEVSAGRYCQAQRERFFRLARATPEELEEILDQAVERYRDQYALCS